MSILNDINKTIDDTDMLIWYKEEYIPFVLDHIKDVVEVTNYSRALNEYSVYDKHVAYLPEALFSKHDDKNKCIKWMLNNNKIEYDHLYSDDELYYTDEFLKESHFMTYEFNYYFFRATTYIDNHSKSEVVFNYMMPANMVDSM